MSRERVADHQPDCRRVSASGQFLFPYTACSCGANRKPPKILDAMTDLVLAYRPKAKSKPARRRKRRANKLAKAKG